MQIDITLSAKHFRNATRFSDPVKCPLANALKEHFKTENVIVGGNCAIVDNHFYSTDWSAYKAGKSINSIITNAKKKRAVGEHIVRLDINIINAELSMYNKNKINK